jgi:subtilisin family serine protease
LTYGCGAVAYARFQELGVVTTEEGIVVILGRIFRAGVVISLIGASLIGFAGTTSADPTTSVIVDVAPGTDPATIAAKYSITVKNVFADVFNGFSADLTGEQISKIGADAKVVAITEDRIIARIDRGKLPSPAPNKNPGQPPASIPSQPSQNTTPAIRRIGGPLSPTADIDGQDDRRVNADIAILDGGVDQYHPDLNVVGGYDCVPGPRGERGYYDRDGHGTFVAGLAAAIDNGIGIVGAAPGARIWAVRVADIFGGITDSALLCGLQYATRSKEIDVINLSLSGAGNVIAPCVGEQAKIVDKLRRQKRGTPTQIDRIHEQICRAVGRGKTVVAAAGNDSADASFYTPAAYPEVITASAMADFDGKPGALAPTPAVCFPEDHDDHFAVFSNFGAPVDIAAPGVCVGSLIPGGFYALADGTSFAAPQVSGAAALLLANQSLSPTQVRQRILAAAEPGPLPDDPDQFPEGVLQISTF